MLDDTMTGVVGVAAGRPLGEREAGVLRILAERQGRVVTRQELVRRAGLRDMQPRRVDVLLVGIRRLVGPENLVNVRNRGWMLLALPPAAVQALLGAADAV